MYHPAQWSTATSGSRVTVSATDAANRSGLPPKATKARFLFDDDGRFNPRGVPNSDSPPSSADDSQKCKVKKQN